MAWKLPVGYTDKEGQTHREIEVREMDGYDEEVLLKGKGKNFARVATQLLCRCVTSVGDVKPDKDLIQGLTVSDRNYLLIAVRIASLGEVMEFKTPCPFCKTVNEVKQDLTELEIREGDDLDLTLTLPRGIEKDGEVHKEVELRLLTGVDQEELSTVTENPAALINASLVKSIVRIGALDKIDTHTVMSMKKRDRDAIMFFMRDKTPGVVMEVDVQCGACDAEFRAPLGVENFFTSRAT